MEGANVSKGIISFQMLVFQEYKIVSMSMSILLAAKFVLRVSSYLVENVRNQLRDALLIMMREYVWDAIEEESYMKKMGSQFVDTHYLDDHMQF